VSQDTGWVGRSEDQRTDLELDDGKLATIDDEQVRSGDHWAVGREVGDGSDVSALP